MYKNFIPCVYFPTTVVLVDDESSFLESIESGLGKKIALQTFQTVDSAANFLKNSGSPKILVDKWKLYPRTSPYFDDHVREFDVDVQKICDVMYNADRFRQVAVVVVDYAMPGLNGLEFCRTIQDSPFKKVLLTGEADEKIAVDAFNEGLIHRFIRKDEPGYLDKLRTVIFDLEAMYFQDMSKAAIANLTNNPDFLPYCLDDPVFIDFFNQCLVTYRPVEYYLTGSAASFVFLSFDGVPSWLAVKAESEMQSYYEIAALADEKPSAFVLNALKNRQCVPYFYQEADKEGEWDRYLHPSEIIKGNKTDYYVAYIDNPNRYHVKNVDKILSYKKFLETLG